MTFQVENTIDDKDFADCFDAASRHLKELLEKCGPNTRDAAAAAQEGAVPHTWLRTTPHTPLLEHLSFILGNQAFFVRLEDAESFDLPLLSDHEQGREWSAALATSRFPGTLQGLMRIAAGYKGHACIMPMRRYGEEGWRPALRGWGLLDLRALNPMDPEALVNQKRVIATDWELHDMAVQEVRSALSKEGRRVLSWTNDPGVMPSVWFNNGLSPCWIIIRACRAPLKTMPAPDATTIEKIKKQMQGAPGYYACVSFSGTDEDGTVYRGETVKADYQGMTAL